MDISVRIYSVLQSHSLVGPVCLGVYREDLKGSATHCNTLQHTATHRNMLPHAATHLQHTTRLCNTLQHTALRHRYCLGVYWDNQY